MFWKCSTVSIALLGFLASSFAAGEKNAPCQHAGQPCDTPVVTSGGTSPLATPKQTDKELIEKQRTCPVTDEPLGSMGNPVKVVVKGRSVFLCCAGCKKKLLANPDFYLQKLDQQK
jgi:hypothetical protein